jgi:hypothetical protein
MGLIRHFSVDILGLDARVGGAFCSLSDMHLSSATSPTVGIGTSETGIAALKRRNLQPPQFGCDAVRAFHYPDSHVTVAQRDLSSRAQAVTIEGAA